MNTRAIVPTLLLLLLVPTTSQPATYNADGHTQPVIKEKPNPEPPADYRGPKIEAVVVLKAVFSSSGEVTDIRVVKVVSKSISKELSKDLAKRCVEAAKQIKFEPATRKGRRVSMLMQLEYDFKLY